MFGVNARYCYPEEGNVSWTWTFCKHNINLSTAYEANKTCDSFVACIYWRIALHSTECDITTLIRHGTFWYHNTNKSRNILLELPYVQYVIPLHPVPLARDTFSNFPQLHSEVVSVTYSSAAMYSVFTSSADYSVSPIVSVLSAFTCSYDTKLIDLSANTVCCVDEPVCCATNYSRTRL
jgi:hypothetical protein